MTQKYDNRGTGYIAANREGACLGRGSITDTTNTVHDAALVASKTKAGGMIIHILLSAGVAYDAAWNPIEGSTIWKKAGVLFPNESDNSAAPAFTGSFSMPGMDRVSAWTGEKDGAKYMSLRFQPPYRPDGDAAPAPAPRQSSSDVISEPEGFGDSIPF